jgi:hypothetical protein
LCEPVDKRRKPKAQDDAADVELVPLIEIPKLKLAFDHMEIIKAANIL